MSIQKDVEKMYREDMDKQRKKKKRRKNKSVLTVVFIVILLALLLALLKYLGIGFGSGSGGDKAGENAASGVERTAPEDSAAETTQSEPEMPKEYVGIKVSGSVYIYNDQVYELEVLRESISKMKDNVVILITDDNSTQNAMEALTTTLAGDGREYVIESKADETEDESSSDSESSAAMTVTTLVP